jgi:RNA polymerase sigma factor (TIGR02999 family)
MTPFSKRCTERRGRAADRSRSSSSGKEVDLLLSDVSTPERYSKLIRLVYGELRHIAAHFTKNERPDHTLQPIELVHELFIRLAASGPARYQNRGHFFAIAARAMYRILIEHARARGCQKRGGGWQRVPLEDIQVPGLQQPEAFAVDELLKELERFDKQLCWIVRLRVLERLTMKEIAEVLNIGESTVRRDWVKAKTWIAKELQDE